MPLGAIEKILKDRMGLHSSTVGSGTILHAVEQRMRDCDITDIADYGCVLQHSETELDALIDTVIIPETWFFRDTNPFEALSQWLQKEWLARHASETLRLLSVPCSSGEEAYTLAMCLSDTGISSRHAHIDAIDISSVNIDKAHKGEYGRNSFRGNNLAYRDRHFNAIDARYRVNNNIREYVSFEQVNMLDQSFTTARSPYHVIFCRNLLIYFDRETQDHAIDRLETLLTRDGLLFLGHSETGLLLNRDFTPLDNPRCFGFRRGRDVAARKKVPAPSLPGRRKFPRNPNTVTSAEKPVPLPFSDVLPVKPVTAAEKQPDPHGDLLQQAFRLADEGHLGEAAEHCENLLAEKAHQADAYFLLGLIRESAGNLNEAEKLLRKSVYLDPSHHEALVHLGILCEQLGDATSASHFRERAERTAPTLLSGAGE